jgi:hypothetical protein
VQLKLRCDERFTHAFTACGSVFKVITLVGLNQGTYFENATTCSKRMRKTTVATQLKFSQKKHEFISRFQIKKKKLKNALGKRRLQFGLKEFQKIPIFYFIFFGKKTFFVKVK